MKRLPSIRIGITAVAWAAFVHVACAEPREIDRLLDALMSPPAITTAAGFSARLVVPPGQFYDPLFMTPADGGAWIADDGGAEGEDAGGMILAVDARGALRTVIGLGQTKPLLAFDIAPAAFGTLAGRILALEQLHQGERATNEPHQIVSLDAFTTHREQSICTLPRAGRANGGVPAWGADAQFGPPGTAFGGRFFAITMFNGMIYQLGADGICTPFAEIPRPFGAPLAFTFSADGSAMLVTVQTGDAGAAPAPGGGAVLRVDSAGKVDAVPLVAGLTRPSGIGVAPPEFGEFGGQLFLTEVGTANSPVKPSQPEASDGSALRVAGDGRLLPVASGFLNPLALRFVGGELWVSDIGGDYQGGGRELPDGFVAAISARATGATPGEHSGGSGHQRP